MAVSKSARRRGADARPRKRAARYNTENLRSGVGGRDSTGLPNGAVATVKALRYGIPEGTPEEGIALGESALGTVLDVMRGEFRKGATDRLKAATYVSELVRGKVAQHHEHSGDVTITLNTGIEAEPPGAQRAPIPTEPEGSA